MISDDAKKMLELCRLGFVATVSPEGAPNLSPKGSIFAYDDEHLAFADIRSPQTVSNIKLNPAVEVNIVDPLLRRGYRFRGEAKVLHEGPDYECIMSHYRDSGVKNKIGAIVMIHVKGADTITSPLYDLGFTEEQIKAKQKELFDSM